MLPESIPTVTVTGRFLAPNGRPLTGNVTFRAPAVVTFPNADVILGGPVIASLNAAGQLEVDGGPVVLPATDAPGMDPAGWSYTVTEQLAGVPSNRSYNVVLPAEKSVVDLADIAPRDPSRPNYVPVKGDTGPIGPAGTPGSRIYTGTAAPDPALGADGDLYIRYESSTLLGVTSTTVSTWQRAAGAWAQQPGDIRGAAWYVNTASTPSTGTRPGDLLLRTDTGDLWQRSAAGWGNPVGNLRGPKGDPGPTGSTGAAGPKGDPGGVQSINGQSQAVVNLAAADVGAVANNGEYSRMSGMLHIVYAGTSADVFKASSADDLAYTAINKSAQLVTTATGTFPDIRIGGESATLGGGTGGVIAFANAATPPTTNPTGAVLYAEGGALKVRQADGAAFTLGAGGTGAVSSVNTKTGAVVLAAADVGALATATKGAANGVASLDASSRLPVAQLPTSTPRNTWTPQALGFQAWSCDPAHVSNPTTIKAATVQRLYMSGINITEPTQVNRVAMFARGWAGSAAVPAARFYAGIYNEAGTRVATSGLVSSLPEAGQLTGTAPGAMNNHIGAVPVPLTAAITLQPGRYWAAFLLSAGSATDFYYMHIQNESPSAPANFYMGTTFQRAWCLNGQTSLPATVNQAAGEVGLDPAIMALAMV